MLYWMGGKTDLLIERNQSEKIQNIDMLEVLELVDTWRQKKPKGERL